MHSSSLPILTIILRFVIWMKLAPLGQFRKLWGVINTPLSAGDVVLIKVWNRYNSFGFNGEKSVVLSTTTWLGVFNPFLGIAFLVTGLVSIVIGGVFFVAATFVRPRRLGDLSVLDDVWR